MKLMSIAALAVSLSFIAGSAQAAWQAKAEGDDDFFVAWVHDAYDNELTVDCDPSWGDHSVAIISDEAWDPLFAYPESVPVTFSVDGRQVASIAFSVENAGGYAAIAAYEMDAPEVFDLVREFGMADSDIVATFLDQELHFSADEAFWATTYVSLGCYT